jgi:predicted metal-dependent phosphoesterase TrpH
VSLSPEELGGCGAGSSLGRRHLAALLVKTRRVDTVREAFARYLGDRGRVAVPKLRLPVADAVALVRAAGGIAAWAHPAHECTRERLHALRALGLQAVEAEYPSHRPSLTRTLRQRAAELGLAVTGGSDCHGPGPPRRSIGASGVSVTELATLRELANADAVGPPG